MPVNRQPTSIKDSGKITKHRTPRVPQAHLTAGIAIAARPPTFREVTSGTGLTVPSEKTTGPFVDHTQDRSVRSYDDMARAWVARALREPAVVAKITHNTGTTPELVVIGRYLSKGFILGKNLLFQQVTYRSITDGFRRLSRRFVVDVAILYGGKLVNIPVDGTAWHDRLLTQQLKDAARNRFLGQANKVVVVPERVTYHAQDLDRWMESHGIP